MRANLRYEKNQRREDVKSHHYIISFCLLYTSVIDSRYRSRRPMIITTNLKLSELKNPPDLAHARISVSYTHLTLSKIYAQSR